MTKKQFKELAKTPSLLLRTAISDLLACEATPGIVVDMSYWLEEDGPTCYVCFAGATIRQQFGVKTNDAFHELKRDWVIEQIAGALNAVRQGAVLCYVAVLSEASRMQPYFGMRNEVLEIETRQPSFFPTYKTNRDGFLSAMHKIADDLQAIGL